MVRIGATYVAHGMTWMVVKIGRDGLCTVVADDPLRAGTFDEDVPCARVPLATLAARFGTARTQSRPAA
jgi:hypothetical protein